MAYKSLFNDVIFIEGDEDNVQIVGQLEYKKEALYNNQLKNLDNVKAQLAEKAKRLNANAVIDFKYGQKNTSWLRSMVLSLDDNVNWYGSGKAAILSPERYNEIVENIRLR